MSEPRRIRRERGAGFGIVIPRSIGWPGWQWKVGRGKRWFAVRIWWHTLQSGQRWAFFVGGRLRKFGYLTHGDAKPEHDRYHDAGWWLPWMLPRRYGHE